MSKASFIFCFLLLSSVTFSQNARSSQPNILFILVDDLGFGDLSCTGSKYYETPNIDKLASQSTQFACAYASCQVCSPSRASIMSGMYPTHHGITDYIGAPMGEDWRKQNRSTKLLPAHYTTQLDLGISTIPEMLKSVGYKTFFAGKWHLGCKGFFPQDQGFDVNKGGNETGHPSAYFSPYDNDELQDGPAGENLEMRLAKETISFINENKKSPFLAYLSFYAVHSPIQTTKEKWNYYRNKAEKMGISMQGFEMERIYPTRIHQDNPVYAGLISSVDDAVGEVLNTLRSLGLDDHTIVIFTSDNGGVVSGDAYSTNLAPLRGGKGYQWEGGLRVPLFIKIPKTQPSASPITYPVSGIDFLPTILDWAHVKNGPSQKMDGVSLLPLFNGKSPKDRNLFWHYPHYGNQGGEPSSIIQSKNWKLIHYWEDGRDELFDLSSDLSEQYDLSASKSTISKKLRSQLDKWLTETGAKYPEKDPLYSSKEADLVSLKNRTELLQKLEKARSQMLDPDFQPNPTWWNSNPVKKN